VEEHQRRKMLLTQMMMEAVRKPVLMMTHQEHFHIELPYSLRYARKTFTVNNWFRNLLY
jgi:hypothetical protein